MDNKNINEDIPVPSAPKAAETGASGHNNYERKVIGIAISVFALVMIGVVVIGWGGIRTAINSVTGNYKELKINLFRTNFSGDDNSVLPVLPGGPKKLADVAACIRGVPVGGENPIVSTHNLSSQEGIYYLYRYPAISFFEVQIPLFKNSAAIDSFMQQPLSQLGQNRRDINTLNELLSLKTPVGTEGVTQEYEWWGVVSLGGINIQYLLTQNSFLQNTVGDDTGGMRSFARRVLLRWRISENAMILIASENPIPDKDFGLAVGQLENLATAYIAQCAPVQ